MYITHAVFYFFLATSSFTFGAEFEYDGWIQLRLWHSLNGASKAQFVDRGNITISSIRNGASTAAQVGLVVAQMRQLHDVAEKNGEYLLKIQARTSRGSEMTFLTNAPACKILGSDLEDTLNVWLDGGGEPIAVNILPQGLCLVREPFTTMWTTDVRIKYPEAGPVPDTTTYIQKLEREKEAKERGETKDNRSFFAKYWMYIVPGVIIVILSSAANPEAGGGATSGAVQRQ